MSQHIPKREYLSQGEQEPPLEPEHKIAGEGRGDVGPLTSAVVAIGEIGRTPIPVAESTHHPGEKPYLLLENTRGKDLTKRVNSQLLHKTRKGPLEKLEVTVKEGNLIGHCPAPQTHIDSERRDREKGGSPLGHPEAG